MVMIHLRNMLYDVWSLLIVNIDQHSVKDTQMKYIISSCAQIDENSQLYLNFKYCLEMLTETKLISLQFCQSFYV